LLLCQHHNGPVNAMRLLSAIAFLALFAAARVADAAPLPAPHQVDIPLSGGILHAQLYKPDGDGPFPTVIALHGCGGLAGHSEPIQPRYRDWAEHLLKDGNAVLLPDSYGSRELGPQCRVGERRIHARRERVADIVASRQWLMQQPWAAHDRISLLGWANGASALLWAVRPQLSSRGTEPDFRSAIAFYPDCRLSSGAARWRGSWFIPRPIMISTASISRCTRWPGRPTPPRRNAAISAAIPRRSPIRKSASPNGWRGERDQVLIFSLTRFLHANRCHFARKRF
jgi:dienelactone hydrolase